MSRALYKIPLLKSKTPHTDFAELQKEGSISRAEETTTYHPPNIPHKERQLPLDFPKTKEWQQPAQHDTTASHSARRERHRHSVDSRRSSIGIGTDPHVTSDAETQTAKEKKKLSLDEYREKTTHSVENTYSRDSTKVVLRNATGEWRTTIRDLNKLMAEHIPSKDPVDINLRLDPYQTSTSTSFDTGHVGMVRVTELLMFTRTKLCTSRPPGNPHMWHRKKRSCMTTTARASCEDKPNQERNTFFPWTFLPRPIWHCSKTIPEHKSRPHSKHGCLY